MHKLETNMSRRKNGGSASFIVPAMIGALAGFLLSLLFQGQYYRVGGRFLSEKEENVSEYVEHVQSEGHDEEMEEEDVDWLAVTESITVIILVLILLTIAFEKIKIKIEESVDRSLRPIVQSLFGEITVLGFLSLFTFCITKLGVFEIISIDIFGKLGSDELAELFESVHYALFFVLVIFVTLVLLLVSDGIKTEEEWMELDRTSRDEEQIDELIKKHTEDAQRPPSFMKKLKSCLAATFPSIRIRRNETVADQLHFFALRKEFILERSVDPPFDPTSETNRVPDNFNFGRYLTIHLGHTLAHVVDIHISTWLCMAVFSIIFFFIMLAADMDIVILSWTWAGLGFVDLFTGIIFDIHLDYINKKFACFDDVPIVSQDPEKQPLRIRSSRDLRTSNTDLPPWCYIDMDTYMKNRSFLTKTLSSTNSPNRHDALFWFEREGPHYLTLFFQINLIYTSIYGALFIMIYAPAMYKHSTTGVFIAYVVLSLFPVIVDLYQRRHVVAQMTQVISIGIHRKPQFIGIVNREDKTAKIVRGFLIVNQMIYKAEHGLLDKPLENGSADPVTLLSTLERKEIEASFDGFDPSGDGYISESELGGILSALGAPVNEHLLATIFRALDEDGDGEIDKKEFMSFYARHVMSSDGEAMSIEDEASHLFRMFDTSGDEKITIGELKATFDAFDYGFTVEEIGELIEELDEDGNGSVGEEEFVNLLYKYGAFLKNDGSDTTRIRMSYGPVS